MANWIQYAYRDYLKPLIGLMKKQLLSENILHADETPVQVLKEKGRKYQPSRAGAYASKLIRYNIFRKLNKDMNLVV